jgi:hypothetical protein
MHEQPETFHFGSWLTREVALTGLTTKKFSDAAGIDLKRLRGWMKQSSPKIGESYRQRLSDALGVSKKKLERLLGLSAGEPKADTGAELDPGSIGAVGMTEEVSTSGNSLITFFDQTKPFDRFPFAFGPAKAKRLLGFEKTHGDGSLIKALSEFLARNPAA